MGVQEYGVPAVSKNRIGSPETRVRLSFITKVISGFCLKRSDYEFRKYIYRILLTLNVFTVNC